jgi:hypothetical protein
LRAFALGESPGCDWLPLGRHRLLSVFFSFTIVRTDGVVLILLVV